MTNNTDAEVVGFDICKENLDSFEESFKSLIEDIRTGTIDAVYVTYLYNHKKEPMKGTGSFVYLKDYVWTTALIGEMYTGITRLSKAVEIIPNDN